VKLTQLTPDGHQVVLAHVGSVLEELEKVAVQHHDDLPCLPAAVGQSIGERKRNSQATNS
jgi:hypothetical protein